MKYQIKTYYKTIIYAALLMIISLAIACKSDENEEITINDPIIRLTELGDDQSYLLGDTISLTIDISGTNGLISDIAIDIMPEGLKTSEFTDQLNNLIGKEEGTMTVDFYSILPGEYDIEVVVTDQQEPANESRATINVKVDIRNDIKLITNPSNPTFLSVQNDTAFITYTGVKDAKGLPTQLENIFYHDTRTDEDLTFSFNDDNTPKLAISSNGESVEFIYDNGQLTRLLITNDAGYRVNIPIGDNTGGRQTDFNSRSGTRNGRMRIVNNPVIKPVIKHKTLNENSNRLILDIDKCGFDISNANVYVDLKGDTDVFSQTLEGKLISGSRYAFDIPKPEPAISFDAEEYCDAITGVIETSCDILSFVTAGGNIDPIFICPVIAAAFAATPIPGDEILVFSGCNKLLRTMGKVCAFVSISAGSGSVFDDPNLPGISISDACVYLDKLNDSATEYSVTPKVFIPGEGLRKLSEFIINASTPLVEKSYDIDATPGFAVFTTNPVDPAPGQDYVATVDIECAEPDSRATISVLGTDGYTDSQSVTITQATTNISFFVPGADGGVKDIITVELSTGQTSSISIVF